MKALVVHLALGLLTISTGAPEGPRFETTSTRADNDATCPSCEQLFGKLKVIPRDQGKQYQRVEVVERGASLFSVFPWRACVVGGMCGCKIRLLFYFSVNSSTLFPLFWSIDGGMVLVHLVQTVRSPLSTDTLENSHVDRKERCRLFTCCRTAECSLGLWLAGDNDSHLQIQGRQGGSRAFFLAPRRRLHHFSESFGQLLVPCMCACMVAPAVVGGRTVSSGSPASWSGVG